MTELRLYAEGKRTNGPKAMLALADRISEAEIQAVAQYLASLR